MNEIGRYLLRHPFVGFEESFIEYQMGCFQNIHSFRINHGQILSSRFSKTRRQELFRRTRKQVSCWSFSVLFHICTGSEWDPFSATLWIRIRISITVTHPDPHNLKYGKSPDRLKKFTILIYNFLRVPLFSIKILIKL